MWRETVARRRCNGTAYVDTGIKRWDGTQWVNCQFCRRWDSESPIPANIRQIQGGNSAVFVGDRLAMEDNGLYAEIDGYCTTGVSSSIPNIGWSIENLNPGDIVKLIFSCSQGYGYNNTRFSYYDDAIEVGTTIVNWQGNPGGEINQPYEYTMDVTGSFRFVVIQGTTTHTRVWVRTHEIFVNDIKIYPI